MTIGIAAVGPQAGAAVVAALAAVERVGQGSIGGFAVLAALTHDGLKYAATQRGGTATLFVEGEATGVPIPQDIAKATSAALISSGPDRPPPLHQFLPARAGVGLVTGHRFPNAVCSGGMPLNEQVLALLADGKSASQAVDEILAANPYADAGFLAVDRHGQIYADSSPRVKRRPDTGTARREAGNGQAVVQVVHNAIHPVSVMGPLAAETAIRTMTEANRPAQWLTVRAGTPLQHGSEDAVVADGDLVATSVVTTDATLVRGRHNCAAVYLHSKVRQNGRIIGLTTVEPNVVVENGRILSLNGRSTCRVGFRDHSAEAES